MPVLDYSFSQEDFSNAIVEWGCNCGPSALAFALQTDLETARDAIPEFVRKQYTSPTMMAQALDNLRVVINRVAKPDRSHMFAFEQVSLVRIQFTGPWMHAGCSPKWKYWFTHWIAAWMDDFSELIFDCNGGVQHRNVWENETIPRLINECPKADGGWFPTHVWRIAANPFADDSEVRS